MSSLFNPCLHHFMLPPLTPFHCAMMEPSSNYQQELNLNKHDFYIITKEIKNLKWPTFIAPGTKDSRVHEKFGCGADVALLLWQMLFTHDLVMPGGQIIHVLWKLYFLKAIPKTRRWMCSCCQVLRGFQSKDFLQVCPSLYLCYRLSGNLCSEYFYFLQFFPLNHFPYLKSKFSKYFSGILVLQIAQQPFHR